jgi:hypothetical protein
MIYKPATKNKKERKEEKISKALEITLDELVFACGAHRDKIGQLAIKYFSKRSICLQIWWHNYLNNGMNHP